MADLKIKATSGNLVLADDGGDAAITVASNGTTTFAENATLSGTGNQITSLGTVTSGTLGSAVVFNDAHKDIDGGADSWLNYLNSPVDLNSGQVVDFQTTRLGSNITESAGSVTVGKAGWYLIFDHIGKNNTTDDYMEFYLEKNGTKQIGRGYFESGAEIYYLAVSSTWFVEAAANDVFRIFGQGNLYGAGNNYSTMSYWGGVRLGA